MNSSRLLRCGAVFHWTPTTFADAYRDFEIAGTPDIRGGVASFNGSSYVKSKSLYNSLQYMSAVVRFKSSEVSATKSIATLGTAWGVFQLDWSLRIVNGYLQLTIWRYAVSAVNITASGTYNDGKDHTAIIIYDANNVYLYVDGTYEGTVVRAYTAGKKSNYTFGTDFLNPSISTVYDCVVFPRAISATEIANISKGDPFPWPRTIYNNYNIDGVTKTHEPFSSAQLTNIIANLKSDGASALGLTTLDIADISREYGVA